MASCPLPLVQRGCLLMFVIAFMSLGYAAGQGIDACPANSPHKALPFLKTAKPEAISALVGTGSTFAVNMNAVTDFAKVTLVPMIGANVFFFTLAALFLVIFILWRFLRFCCYIICCRGSCDAKREKVNVYELLFSTRMKVLKGFMFLFGLVAIVFAIYGMASAGKQKDIVTPAFGVIGTFNDYFGRLSGDVDDLMATISNVTSIIDSFEDVITKNIGVDNLTATLTAIGQFLDSDASPPLITNLITDFTTRYNAFTDPAPGTPLRAFVAGVNPFKSSRDTLQGCLTTLSSAQSGIAGSGGMTAVVNDVQTALTGLGSTYWDTDTPANGPGTSTALTLLNTNLQLMKLGTAAGSWHVMLGSISAALDCVFNDQAPAGDPFKVLGNLATSLETDYTSLAAALDLLIAQITKLKTENQQNLPTMNYLANRLVYINTSILGLTPDMQSAYDSLTAASTSASQLTAGNPTPIDSALAKLAIIKTTLAQLVSVSSLKTNLVAASTLLESAPTAPFSGTAKTNYQTWINAVRATLNDPSSYLATFKAAVSAYTASPTGANWNALSILHDNSNGGDVVDGYTNFHMQFNVLSSSSNGVNDPVAVGPSSNVQTAATAASVLGTSLATTGSDVTLGTSAANTAATAAEALTNPMPALGVEAQLSTVNTNYAAFGSPYSKVVSTPKTQLTQLKTNALDSGNSAKQQINSSVSSVNSSVAQMKTMLVGKLTKVQTDYEPLAKKYDGYRYDASMALYGISILFVGLIFLSACLNYHFGANVSTFILLIITVLYFLLALVIALLISVLYLGCGDLEHLILQFAPQLSSTFAPVISYYFGTDQTLKLKTVLKTANLVDIDAMMAQIQNSQGNIVSSLAGAYTLKSVPLTVLGRINGTISGINASVDTLLTTLGRDGLLPVYGDVKGLVCCLVPDFMTSMWIGLSFAGIFAFALIFCTFFYIGKLDQTPRKDCCGCTCHTAAKYEGTVFPDTLPQFQAPGFENHMGPYDAPNGAYVGEPTVVINASHEGARKAV